MTILLLQSGPGGAAAVAPPVLSYPTWSTAAADKDTGIVLSNGNLTVGSTVSSAGGVRATAGGASGGKYYYEVSFVAGTAGSNTGCGIIPAANSITNWAAAGTGGLINLNFSSGQIYYSGSSTGITLGSLFASHTICNAIDLVNNRFWARIDGGNWNGSGTADPATNVGGINISSIFSGIAAYPAASMQAAVSPCSTANFGASSFAFSKPSGFSSFGV